MVKTRVSRLGELGARESGSREPESGRREGQTASESRETEHSEAGQEAHSENEQPSDAGANLRKTFSEEVSKALLVILPSVLGQYKDQGPRAEEHKSGIVVDAAKDRERDLDRTMRELEAQESKKLCDDRGDRSSSKRVKVLGSGVRPDTRKREERWCDRCSKRHKGACASVSSGGVICFICGKPGHVSRECPEKDELCFVCHKPSHVNANCSENRDMPRGHEAKDVGNSGGRGRRVEMPKARECAYAMMAEEAVEAPDVVTGTLA